MNIIELAFEKATGIPNAWTNPALMQARNGFIQGWELAVAHEREECAKVIELHAGIIDTPNAFIGGPSNFAKMKARDLADSIRARGTT